jgi:hypothetical protein
LDGIAGLNLTKILVAKMIESGIDAGSS